MAGLDNGSANPDRCAKVECFISSFDVTITPATDSLTAVISDPCSQITDCRMAKAVLSKAILEYLEDEGITAPDGGCPVSCCDGIYGAAFVFGTLTATLAITGVVAGPDVVYTVSPPFSVVN